MAKAQLIIEGQIYPEADSNTGSYSCEDQVLSKTLTMIAGNIVEEVQGIVTVISYSYPYFDNDLMRKCLQDLKGKRVVTVTFLNPDSNERRTSKFLCTTIPNPKFRMSVDDVPYWTDISFVLREVEPHA